MTCLCDHHFEWTQSVVRETEFADKNSKKTYRTTLLPNNFAHTLITVIILWSHRPELRLQWVNGPSATGPAFYIGTRSLLAAVCAARWSRVHDFVFPLSTVCSRASPRSWTEHGLESGPPLQQWCSGVPEMRRKKTPRRIGLLHIIFTIITLQNNRRLLCQDSRPRIHPQINEYKSLVCWK